VLAPGTLLDGRYEILAPLAEGGMGAVYRARRLLLGDQVAIKVVRPDHSSPSARERFLRESRAAASLRHPSIVSIYDFDMPADGPPYLVMELLSGPSLREEIEAAGRLQVEDVARILTGICSALELTHAHGIVHRDLKPANIVAHEYGSGQRAYKLVDFGIANLRQSTEETRLTGAYQFVGTAAYAAPEQLSGSEVDARTDVYALAAVVFEMLTGRPPFAGADLLSIVSAQLTTPAPRLRAVRPDLPPSIDEAVARGLAKAPDERWRSVAEFRDALLGTPQSRGGSAAAAAPSGGLAAVYEVGEFLGRGRLGSQVFRGMHRALGHPVAIRILRSDAHPNWSGVRDRFLREAKGLQIAHPSIIQVRDYGESAGSVYVVTDFIEGPSVREVLERGGAVPWPRLRSWLDQLVDAARALHRRKVLLCGLTPDIMRVAGGTEAEPEERLMISTAGIGSAQDLLATLNDATLRGVSLEDGELRYVAPELLTGAAVDERSDIFTIGVLAYELASGRPPYDGRTMPELLGRMLAGAPEPLRAAAPALPDEAADAILKALRPSPGDRFDGVPAFASALGLR